MIVGQNQKLVLMCDIRATVALGSEVFSKCEQELGWCADSKKPFRLELNTYDMFGLQGMYPSSELSDQEKLVNVMADILSEINSPYGIITIFRPDPQGLLFFGKVECL